MTIVRPNNVTAYCFQNGRIHFTTDDEPEGSLIILAHPQAREIIEPKARWSYPQKGRDGKPIKGTSVPLVPGVPEADSESDKLYALMRFRDWVVSSLHKSLIDNRRNEHGVKDQTKCYRTIDGVLFLNAGDVLEPGGHESTRAAAISLADEYRGLGYAAHIEAQDSRTWWRVFVEAPALYTGFDVAAGPDMHVEQVVGVEGTS